MLFDSYGEYVFYDGAMGTMLQRRGLEPGLRPDVMNITAPDVVEGVYRLYLEAGSEIICTNTFGANADALRHTGHSPEDIIATGVSIARRAAERAFEENVIRNGVGGSASATTRAAKVALDIGPIGKLMEPMGDLEYEGAYDLFKQQAIAGENAGADLAAIETMSDITEMKAAISAIVENTNLPVFATMTFGASGKTYLGFSAEDFAKTAESAGADAIGINCSRNPAEMVDTALRIAASSSLPLIFKLNAGLPDSASGEYNVSAEEFAMQMIALVKAVRAQDRDAARASSIGDARGGAEPAGSPKALRRQIFIGGCCGTTPDYIRELRKAMQAWVEAL